MSFSERRTAVRMLQAPTESDFLEASAATLAPTPRSGTVLQLPSPTLQSFRRRSTGYPSSAQEEATTAANATSNPIPAALATSRASSSTAPPSPVSPPRRATLTDGGGYRTTGTVAYGASGADCATSLSGSASPLGAPGDPDSPHRLSVPLTLLSLHNGGTMRHGVGRGGGTSRDLSSLASLGSPREREVITTCVSPRDPGSPACLSSPSVTAAAAAGSAAGSSSPTPAGFLAGAAAAGGYNVNEHLRADAAAIGLRPSSLDLGLGCGSNCLSPRRTGTTVRVADTASGSSLHQFPALRAPPPIGTSTSGGPGSPLSPGRPLLLQGHASSVTSGRGGGGEADTAAQGGDASLTGAVASCGVGGGGSGGGGAGGASLTVPSHLGAHRPPTPICREDDLMTSMRHMTSPSRRRSRFASAADSSLLVAAAAAIAAEEAGLLPDPPSRLAGGGGFATASSPSAFGGGGGGGGGGGLSPGCAGGASESRSRRASFFCAGGPGNDGGGGGGVVGVPGELPLSRSLVTGPPWGPGAGTASPRGAGSLSTSWRSASQLMPVIEEPLRPLSRGVDEAPATSSGPQADRTSSSSAVSGSSAASRPGAGEGGSPLAGRPSPLAPPPLATAASMGRRARPSCGAHGGTDAGPSAPPGGKPGLHSVPCAVTPGPPPDDSLSSFMHSISFGPGAAAAAAAVSPGAEAPRAAAVAAAGAASRLALAPGSAMAATAAAAGGSRGTTVGPDRRCVLAVERGQPPAAAAGAAAAVGPLGGKISAR